MKQLSRFSYLFVIFALASCSGNDEPDIHVFMQPSAITTQNVNGDNSTFVYDEYGRIVEWNCKSNGSDNDSYSARYSYPDRNTIKITAKETKPLQQREFEETIHLTNGRASKCEGTLIFWAEENSVLRKTYRIELGYLPSNHLNVVKHSEVVGIGDELNADAWDNAWTWENYLIWENGNLTEFQDFNGKSTLYRSTKYEYSADAVDYDVVVPVVINNLHHLPLCRQGVFGLNSVNLVKTASTFDERGILNFERGYTYKIEENRITEYTETFFGTSALSNPIVYKVDWTEK